MSDKTIQPKMPSPVMQPDMQQPQKDFLQTIMEEDKPLHERMAKDFGDRLFDEKLLYMISDLSAEQRYVSIQLDIIKRFYIDRFCTPEDAEKVGEHIKALLKFTISKNRMGRTELVDMIIGLRGGLANLLGFRKDEGRRGFFNRG